MKLLMTNHYPFPYPENVSVEGGERISNEATDRDLRLDGVIHFEMKHTVTIEFESASAMQAAQEKTGWKPWGTDGHILEAPVSAADGYGPFPAIIANNEAWCGYILKSDTTTVTHTTRD